MDGGNLPLFPGVLSQMHEVSKDQTIIQTDGIVTGDSKSLGIEITLIVFGGALEKSQVYECEFQQLDISLVL